MAEQLSRIEESRWPVVLAMFAEFLLMTAFRSRVRVFPQWFPYVAMPVIIAPLVAIALNVRQEFWRRAERIAIALFFCVYGGWTLLEITALFRSMLTPASAVTGLQLLTSSIAVWGTNVVMFSVAYWRVDRGGPDARMKHLGVAPDWHFPIEDLSGSLLSPGWSPRFVDYLFLAFTTATAFSPTEAMPITHRAKLLMILEGFISLVTILAVAARAINILGT